MTIAECVTRLENTFGSNSRQMPVGEWVAAMRGATDDELNIATARLIRESKFMPRPADMWELINAVRVDRAPVCEPIVEHWRRQSFVCRDCDDTGLRSVWHPRAMQGAVRFVRGEIGDEAFRRSLASCMVKCPCQRGRERRLTKPRQRFTPASHNGENYEPGELTLKPSIMVEVAKTGAVNQVNELLDWAREFDARTPANYVAAFDDFD